MPTPDLWTDERGTGISVTGTVRTAAHTTGFIRRGAAQIPPNGAADGPGDLTPFRSFKAVGQGSSVLIEVRRGEHPQYGGEKDD
jgi:hypothetical protein